MNRKAVTSLWCYALQTACSLGTAHRVEKSACSTISYTDVYHCEQVFRLHVSGLFILATYLDIVAILTIAKEVVCILPLWVPMVDLDLRSSAGWLQVLHSIYTRLLTI
jgi:hypothetical protein